MPKYLLFSLVLFLSLGGLAQVEYARKIMDTLCSPHFDGRGYVNSGDIRAADFIVDELKRIGAEPMSGKEYTQEYTFSVNTFPHPIEVILGKDTLLPGADYLVHPISGTAQGEFDLIEINKQNFFDTYGGKIDFRSLGTSQTVFAFNFTGIEDKELEKQIISLSYECTHYFPSVYVTSDKLTYSVSRKQTNYPLIFIDSAAYHSVDQIKLKVNNIYIPDYTAKNVIGCIPGKKKKKYVVFSAHYDHLGRMGEDTYFPGANDNASGVAMLLSLAKHYKTHPPKYTVVFCFFSGEEAGLLGSKYFVEHPYFKLKKTKFVLNIDIMGGATDGITVVNATRHEKAFAQLQALNESWRFLPQVKSRGASANSDHHFFSEAGVPAFFIYSMGNVKNYHDIYDTAENTPLINFDQVQELLEKFVLSL
ncbi:MAG: M20/M25/M40 family metallo-hydrolase [Crocinitomicaceae bacterium]